MRHCAAITGLKGIEMKQLTIGTKAQAERVLMESLFKPVNGRTLNRMKYSNGKYKADTNYVGLAVEVSDSVHALYVVKQRDSDGPYARLMCICE